MADSKRQIGVVIDLNRCMGCQTCTVACKVYFTNDKGMDHQWWMKVNTLPGRGYPKDWEQMGGGYDVDGVLVVGKRPEDVDYGGVMEFNYNDVFYGGHNGQVHLAPTTKPTWGPNWDEDLGGGAYPNSYLFYLPRTCNHCWRPACAEACPSQAIHKREEDGLVVVDETSCTTCPEPRCMAACPYKEVYWNSVRSAAQKCDGCMQRVDLQVAPACVRQCPGRAMWVDYLDNEEGTVHKVVKQWKVALPLHPEFNTGPNVYYIPPLAPSALDEKGNFDDSRPRIPIEYLRQLFGPNVDAAIGSLQEELAKRRREPKEPSELMELLMARRWHEVLGPFTNDPREVQA